MSYFLTDDQEYDLNVFLDEENLKVCKTQLESKDVPDELKEIIKKTEEAGSPIPAFNPEYGYYSVSFTPCNEGNRIYAHHHLTNISKAIFDPSVSIIEDDEVVVDDSETPENNDHGIVSSYNYEEDPDQGGDIDLDLTGFTDEEIEKQFAPPEDIFAPPEDIIE